ncbi:putative spermidine/putrescine transport system substrate-binding protein [Actinoplanes lutulentus]|uniref:Putative spermidine/putrescine transport system substrate-binding protein n=1 Tax=Actinoplanes lutulentus TaxID=1287878 RepID=A0A327ZM05_9ACTN|nr:extracellular solute-binding protein [Actinoplanes lutulentus]MBB2940867.1 putative spermidine/putrescine transport system substrate-binding protein [Actinoplanes lutulentus]RAK43176.1 putative spermidine/putrescine transport system substrate-binding protein [Actinoplanes lutulentus]
MKGKVTLSLAAIITLSLAACSPPESGGGTTGADGPVPDKPTKAVTLNVLDVAGNLQLTQGMIDDFVAKNADIVEKVTYTKATAPELVGKIKAQQDANRVDIDLVLTGVDGLAAGIDQGLWLPLLPTHASRLTGMAAYLPGAAAMQELAGDNGVTVTYYPSGPLIEYLPGKVPNPPKNAQELLDFAKANPGAVQYARPSNSGPGRTFLMGLPYLLGDSDPKDPEGGWDKTWAFLKELDAQITLYPSSTSETMKNLANGSAKIILSTTGWDINPRVLGTVPKEAKIGTLEGFHWVTDAHYAVVPKGVSTDKQAAVLSLLTWMLTPEQQAKAYDKGYFFPGPAIKGVPLTMAPQDSQQAIAEFGRPEYTDLIANNPLEVPLDAKSLVAAFDRWDREIGGSKVKK